MTDAFTPERIAETREILARATSGPLQAQHAYNLEGRTTIIGNVDGEYVDGKLDVGFDFVCSTLNYGETDNSAKAKANTAAILTAVNTLPAALDEIEQERASLSAMVQQNEDLRAELSRLRAELDEAVGLLKSTIAPMYTYPADGPNIEEVHRRAARVEAFLSRMEGRKDG